MGTLRIENESEIREMVADCLMPDAVVDYARSLAAFYWRKARELATCMDGKRGAYRKYGIHEPSGRDVTTAMDDCEAAHRLAERVPKSVESIVREIMERPLEAKCDDMDDEYAVQEAMAEVLCAFMNAYQERFEKDACVSLGKLYKHSYGHDDTEHRAVLKNYDLDN